MSLVGFKARNHRQQVGTRGPNPKVDDRQTPAEVFDPLHERFGFTLDACALPHNAKLPRYFTPQQDGLAQSWADERVWCNPPWSNVAPWVTKAWDEIEHVQLIVMLLPANRTEQAWWQDYIEPMRDRSILRCEFLRGRLRFIAHDDDQIRPNSRPPSGACLLIWENPAMDRRAA